MKLLNVLCICLFAATLDYSLNAYAEETATEKTEAAKNKVSDDIKRGYRHAKDEVCELIDGKMKCVIRKMKNKASGAADQVETKAKEVKNKVD